ncbi:MAG: hypothetical protein ACOC4J_01495, partial [Bacteroidota bacterium]
TYYYIDFSNETNIKGSAVFLKAIATHRRSRHQALMDMGKHFHIDKPGQYTKKLAALWDMYQKHSTLKRE